jgi:5,6-dimethylbenzimidazole synthase
MMKSDAGPPRFDETFRAGLRKLVLWRRDVRRFRRDPVDPALFLSLLDLARCAPSVGNCQPWRFVIVDDPARREAVKASFRRANAQALGGYQGERRQRYARLRLEGLDAAPIHFAAFADEATEAGAGLGRRTMPETLHYSVVAAIQTLWLVARAEGLGLGWVSIIEPEVVTRALATPASWRLIGYFCLGWPEEEHIDPELERSGWQERRDLADLILQR